MKYGIKKHGITIGYFTEQKDRDNAIKVYGSIACIIEID